MLIHLLLKSVNTTTLLREDGLRHLLSKGRKKRNLQKNKPERFRHVAEAITIIIEAKTNLYTGGIIEDSDLDSLNKGEKLTSMVLSTILQRFCFSEAGD